MKQLQNLVILAVCSAMMGLMSCGGDGKDLSDDVKALNNLTKSSWSMSSASVDGTDVTTNFAGLVITFVKEGTTYSTNGSYAPVWPNEGSFTLNADGTSFTREDGVVVTIAIDKTSLTLQFIFDELPGGRIEGIVGDYDFEFTAQ